MNEQKNYNGRGIFYGVIGVATLVVAIIGATFAYFTASASNENAITGNMATINLGLTVTKQTTAGDDTGLIPMSNNMVEAAVSANTVCVDDNGNAVCQVYKVTLSNASSAAVFVDGYVGLTGGSGTPSDYDASTSNETTMRWAQVFVNGNKYTTAGDVTLGDTDETVTLASINNEDDTTGKNEVNIRTAYAVFDQAFTPSNMSSPLSLNADKGVLTKLNISDNDYAVIGKNYIRTSDHALPSTLNADEFYSQQADVTCALVYNQLVFGQGNADSKPASRDYYFVVWLSETGTNQNPGEGTSANGFFQGQVKFLSAQGSEVSATFGGYTRVAPTDNTGSTGQQTGA